VSEPTQPSWDDLSAFLTPMQIARLQMLESASTLPNRRSSTAICRARRGSTSLWNRNTGGTDQRPSPILCCIAAITRSASSALTGI
jgi:hypothetical protein